MSERWEAGRVGQTEIRAFVLESDGVVIDLTGCEVQMKYSINGGARVTISTEGLVPLLFITGAATGEMELRPDGDFWVEGIFRFYFAVVPASGEPYDIPRNKEYQIQIVSGA